LTDRTEQSGRVDVPLLEGKIAVHRPPGADHVVFVLGNRAGPIRFAVKHADVPNLIACIAGLYGNMPRPSAGAAIIAALPATGCSAAPTSDGKLAVSFQLTPGASLTFAIPASAGSDLIEALQVALGISATTGQPDRTRLN